MKFIKFFEKILNKIIEVLNKSFVKPWTKKNVSTLIKQQICYIQSFG
jgi:hypothetical protein